MSTAVCTSTEENCKSNIQAKWVSSAAAPTIFIGAIIGQLTMGYVGDLLGRNTAMCITLSIAAFGALGSAVFSFGSPESIYAIIISCRFLLGIGAGGVYPLSATKAAEDSSKNMSGGKVNPVAAGKAFFWQAPGAMTPWFVGFILTYSSISVEAKWRLLLGLGFIPAAIIVCLTMFEMSVRKEAAADHTGDHVEVLLSVPAEDEELKEKRKQLLLADPFYKKQLLITGGSWFIFDVAFYGVSLFGGDIVNAMKVGSDDDVSANSSIRYATQYELIALSMGIPASILTIYLLYTFGTKRVQVYGFFFQAVCFSLMAICFYPLQQSNPDVLFFLYCMLLFSLNAGPAMTTYVLPSETFPVEIRATYNGISAASGKIGAAVGAYMVSMCSARGLLVESVYYYLSSCCYCVCVLMIIVCNHSLAL